MMSKLTRLQAEAMRLLTIFEEYKDSNDEYMRRKAHLDLDRFLMENREVAAILVVGGLQTVIDELTVELQQRRVKKPWYRRIIKGGVVNAKRNNKVSNTVHHEG